MDNALTMKPKQTTATMSTAAKHHSPLLKKGYKQTEVGVIPEDWEAVKLGEHAKFKTGPFGSTLHKSDYIFDGIPIVNPMQIIDGEIIPTPSMTISEKLAQSLADFRLHTSDIVIGRRGDIGRCAVVDKLQNGWLCGTGSMIIKCHSSLLPDYAQRVISSPSVVAMILSASVGTTMVNLNQNTLATLTIQIPPTLAEQEAIAEALSDADSLIESLQQLIAKKRLIKQGAMQELLSPREGWVEKTIGGKIDLLTGFPFPSSKYTKSGIRLLRGSNVKRGVTDWSEHIVQYWSRMSASISQYALKEGDLVIAMDGSLVGRSYARLASKDLPAVLLQRVARIRSSQLDVSYLTQLVGSNLFVDYCDAVKTVTAIPHISPSDIRNFKIPLPPTIEEQTRIATILTDMDEEISTLGSKLTKARQIKQGMMSELLTGKIRLV